MSSNRNYSESELIEKYDLTFRNVKKAPAIGEKLAAAGYNEETLAEGRQLLTVAESFSKDSRSERIKLAEVSEVLRSKREILENEFIRQWKLSRVGLRFNKVIKDKLAISGSYPRTYNSLITASRNFYEVLASNPDLLAKLSRYGITEEKVQEGLKMVEEVVEAHSVYMFHKAESEKTTEVKQYAFDKINKWMRDFYDAARVAFLDEPQQLEAFGVVVKS